MTKQINHKFIEFFCFLYNIFALVPLLQSQTLFILQNFIGITQQNQIIYNKQTDSKYVLYYIYNSFQFNSYQDNNQPTFESNKQNTSMIIQDHQSSNSVPDQQPISTFQIDLTQYISPPNPITTKILSTNEKSTIQNLRKNHYFRSAKLIQTEWLQNQEISLNNFYDKQVLIFQKFNNKNIKERNGKKFAASAFFQNVDVYQQLTKYIGMIKTSQNIEFDSNFQSGNLFQVYKVTFSKTKTGDFQYDLILQNDLNTTGYAQWFNFKIRNKQIKNIQIKLSIINMYKSGSLYQKGMKPLSCSIKEGRKWQRNTFKAQYYENQIPTERQKSNYEFKHKNDEVQFSHFFPYTSFDLQNFISKIKGSNKIKIKNIGNSSLKKPILLIHLFSESENLFKKTKKVIIIIGRQHSGQTQSSFMIEEMVYSLLANNNQSQFLLNKFDFYLCPILNIDGVYLGNYRTNAYGYDLNRYWHTNNQLKLPEVFYFKKFIENVKKRQKIALILDLHGHSKKLGSFFYGNPYGKDYMILPFIASKLCDMIRFKSCAFTEEKQQKSKTARAFLGNLLKQTTHFYTFEVSFWGYKKNNRLLSYTLENLKQLSKTLLAAIYKVFIEQFKEELTLKESVFFKQIRKQLHSLTENYFEKQSGSDSEAEKLTFFEDSGKYNCKQLNKSVKKLLKSEAYNTSKEVGVQADLSQDTQIDLKFIQFFIEVNQQNLFNKTDQNQNLFLNKFDEKTEKIASFAGPKNKYRQSHKKQEQSFDYKNSQKNCFVTKKQFYAQSSPRNGFSTTSRKQFLLSKLRILGGTFADNFESLKKQKEKTLKSIGVQVSSIDNFLNSEVLNSVKNKSFTLNPKFRKQKQLKKYSLPKKKAFSAILNQAGIESQTIFNQKSLQKLKQSEKLLKNIKDSFIIKVSKSPLVKIQKIENPKTIINDDSNQRKNIYKNINRLKSNITILKRGHNDKLPNIDFSGKLEYT